jgi:hypothetical protein
MPRGPLTPAQKQAMQDARQQTRKKRDDALNALATNDQFTNFKMWKKVDSELQDAVLNAIVKAQQWAKHRRIQELRREIEKLQSEL